MSGLRNSSSRSIRFGCVAVCPYTNPRTQSQVCCHQRLHSETLSRSLNDPTVLSAREACVLDRSPSSCLRSSTSFRALVPSPDPRAHPRSYRRVSTPASPTSLSPLPSHICHALLNLFQLPRVGFAIFVHISFAACCTCPTCPDSCSSASPPSSRTSSSPFPPAFLHLLLARCPLV